MITPGHLTGQQTRILEMLADGLSYVEIGRVLWITADTVKSHAKLMRANLGARNAAHAVGIGYRLGILESSPRTVEGRPKSGEAPA